jgi:phosphinothricin acetyltransferase
MKAVSEEHVDRRNASVAGPQAIAESISVQIEIDKMDAADWPEVRAVYLDGIATGNATFELDAPDWTAWDDSHLAFARLVARKDNRVLGWAALTPVSGRCVYSGVAEVSVYVSASARGNGLGGDLLRRLIEESEQHGIWTLQAGIFPENIASLSIHQRCGFREVGRRERLGKLKGVWRDVILLERRSERAGID